MKLPVQLMRDLAFMAFVMLWAVVAGFIVYWLV